MFMDHHKIPFDWPRDMAHDGDHDTTLMAVYPQISAEMPGVILSCHNPSVPVANAPSPMATDDIDWENIADAAA